MRIRITLAIVLGAVMLTSCLAANGRAEPYALHTHCGLARSLIKFDDEFWQAIRPDLLGDADEPPPGFDEPFDHGSILRTGSETALFVSKRGIRIDLMRLADRPELTPCR